MKKSKRVRLLALLLAACSIVAIASGCNKESTTTGDPGGQQGTSTAPEPSTTVAPTTEPKDEQKYYLSGTWLMNETLEPLAELTGKNQKEEIKEEIFFYIGDLKCANFTWTFSYLDYEDGYTTKTFRWRSSGMEEIVYVEGKSFYEVIGWQKQEDRTITFVNDPVEEGEVSEEFYLWFTKNAVKVSDKGIIWE